MKKKGERNVGKFVMRKVATGWKFTLNAANGLSIAASEVYNTRAACLRGMESVRRNAPVAALEDLTGEKKARHSNPKFEMYRDRAGEYRFRLRARNGAIIAVSDGYGTRSACENGVESVRINAVDGEITEE